MSRIRSVHPGLYTDEAWASVSIAARWLAVGLLTEADDNGIFEWKPLQIKMRLFPVDAVDVAALLKELSDLHIVKQYQGGDVEVLKRHGRKPLLLGAIRNFVRFQRPRKPKAWFPITKEIQEFVGLFQHDEPALPKDDLFAGGSELPAVETHDSSDLCGTRATSEGGRMEDGGGKMKEVDPPISPLNSVEPFLPPEPEWGEFVKFRRRAGSPFTDHARKLAVTSLGKLAGEGFDPRAVIERSILNGWKGFFPLREGPSFKPSKGSAKPVEPVGPDDSDPRLADLRQALRKRLSAKSYDGWVKPCRLAMNGTGAILVAPSRFMADWLEQNLASELNSEAGKLGLGSVKVQAKLPESREKETR